LHETKTIPFVKNPNLKDYENYVVLLYITITKTFANEAYLEGFSLKVEKVNIINIDNMRTKQQTVVTVKL
jgi:ribosomal protein L23|tara:strand:- start:161 stop:370 length:210 start_codon:yes stop_codon:yes gene_type:complete